VLPFPPSERARPFRVPSRAGDVLRRRTKPAPSQRLLPISTRPALGPELLGAPDLSELARSQSQARPKDAFAVAPREPRLPPEPPNAAPLGFPTCALRRCHFSGRSCGPHCLPSRLSVESFAEFPSAAYEARLGRTHGQPQHGRDFCQVIAMYV